MSNKDRYFYNPDKKYYFISVNSTPKCPKWIRTGFQTEEDVREFLRDQYSKFPENYSSLEIFDESLLRESVYVKNDNGEFEEVDLRCWMFGSSYTSKDSFYESIIKGETGFVWKNGFEKFEKEESSRLSPIVI